MVEKKKEEEITEMTEEVIERLAEEVKTSFQEKTAEEKKAEKPSIFAKLFKKEEKKEEVGTEEIPEEVRLPAVEEEKPPEAEIKKETIPSLEIELERLKAFLESFKEGKKASDERISILIENVGELRSMIFQNDASLKEISIKMERLSEEVEMLKPKEIDKRFRVNEENLEKHATSLELLRNKIEALTQSVGEMEKTLKAMGSIENLGSINRDIGKKLEEMKEVSGYIERISAKTEKMFLDMSKSVEDLTTIKTKIEALDDLSKSILKTCDELNLKFENYLSKKDFEATTEEINMIKKQLEDINKLLPVLQMNVPEIILKLRKEKENILMFIESLNEELKKGRISKDAYEEAKNSNVKKLAEIDKKLVEEWKKFQRIAEEKEKPMEEAKPVEAEVKPAEAEVKSEVEKPEIEMPQVRKKKIFGAIREMKKLIKKLGKEKKEEKKIKKVEKKRKKSR